MSLNFELSHDKMIKARQLAFFISMVKTIIFFIFDLILIIVLYAYFIDPRISNLVVDLFFLAVVFFKIIDFVKKVFETKAKLS